ncbi:MAG TPA: hypothetical protein VGC67_06640 [Cellulomonas sp.]
MTLAVVLLPDTALLVPGVAGRADPLADLRAAALAALSPSPVPSPADGPQDVLVLAPGHRDRRLDTARASFAAAGVPARLVGEHGPAGAPAPDVPASVALALLAAAGCRAEPVVLEIGRDASDATTLRERGRALAGTHGRDLLVLVVGSLSAREGVDAPLAVDPRADAVDAALRHALAAGPDALAEVLDAHAALLRPGPGGLDVSGWGPWQVLLGLLAAHPAAGPDPRARVLASSTGTALGSHTVAVWDLAAAGGPARPDRPAEPVGSAPSARPEESR